MKRNQSDVFEKNSKYSEVWIYIVLVFLMFRIQFQLSSLTQSVLMRLELFGLLLRDILPNKYFQLGQPTLISKIFNS